MLGLRDDEVTQKAVAAAESRLAVIAAREAETKAGRTPKKTPTEDLEMDPVAEEDDHPDVDLAHAISKALVSAPLASRAHPEKAKTKIKVKSQVARKSALVPATQSMDLD